MSSTSSLPANHTDNAVGVDRYVRILSNTDLAVGLETFTKLSSQLDKATASERLNREMAMRDSSRVAEMFSTRVFYSRDNCVVVCDVVLCYKKVGDVLDYETLQNLLTALKRIDDRVQTWLYIISKILPK